MFLKEGLGTSCIQGDCIYVLPLSKFDKFLCAYAHGFSDAKLIQTVVNTDCYLGKQEIKKKIFIPLFIFLKITALETNCLPCDSESPKYNYVRSAWLPVAASPASPASAVPSLKKSFFSVRVL